MTQTTAAPHPPPPQRSFTGLVRTLRSVALAVVVLLLLSWAIRFMKDQEAPERLLIQFYETFNMTDAAESLSHEGLNPLVGKLIFATITMTLGVGGVWLLFWVASDIAEQLPFHWRGRVMPFVFVGPAVLILTIFLVYPVFNTLFLSLSEDILPLDEAVPAEHWASNTIVQDWLQTNEDFVFQGYLIDTDQFEVARVRRIIEEGDEPPIEDTWTTLLMVYPKTITDEEGAPQRLFATTTLGFRNYGFAFTSPEMHIAFRNNVLWLILGTGASVLIGLLIAALVDRIRYESAAKSLIFMPLAISFVGASVIWKFVYAWTPPNREQIGLLNAVVSFLGGEPIPWIIEPPLNTLALILIMVWLQTGFCMIILSAALKGVPQEIIEAARIDGGNEFQIFMRVTVPIIRGAILTVSTTVFIAILKVFDIVYVMTNGKYDTEVIANRMFVEMFTFRNFGRASSLAFILLAVVIPIMVINIRNLRRQGINS